MASEALRILLLKDFNPPIGCNCGLHYGLNPYDGCEFKCVYCYGGGRNKKPVFVKDDQ